MAFLTLSIASSTIKHVKCTHLASDPSRLLLSISPWLNKATQVLKVIQLCKIHYQQQGKNKLLRKEH